MANAIIYESNFASLPLSFAKIDSLSLSSGAPIDINDPNNPHDPGNLRGYFSKTDLTPILAEPSCVGIRFYNSNPANGSPSLLAIGVNEEGFDIASGLHLFSNEVRNPTEGSRTSFSQSRGLSRTTMRISSIKEEQFSSFFSSTMLNGLINGDVLTGICFYQVALNDIFDPSEIPANLVNRLTHLAVTTNLGTDGKILGIHSNTGFNNQVSELPCPGHCVNRGANAVDFELDTEPFVSNFSSLNDPYIPVWES